MTQVEVLRDWGETAIGVAFWACLLWPAVTALFWPWWQNAWGWNMVIKTEMIALALLASVLRMEFGVASRYALLWVTVLAITAIPLVLAWRTALIWRSQRDGAKRDRQLGEEAKAEDPGKPGSFSRFRGRTARSPAVVLAREAAGLRFGPFGRSGASLIPS